MITASIALPSFAASTDLSVPLHWLDRSPPPAGAGVSWGVPWARGTVQPGQAFQLQRADGAALPLQTWPLAYWPDGSLKWSGFATVGDPQTGTELRLALATAPAGVPTANAAHVRVRRTDTMVEIDTGPLQTAIATWGGGLVETLRMNGRVVGRNGRLVCVVQDGPGDDILATPARESCVGKIETVTVEQDGPVRAVVRLEGRHVGQSRPAGWLPFVVRLYFYAGEMSVRMVHTITYDGDEQKDFIRGLGVEFAVPMREQIHNRHVRFGGEGGGVWAEPIQPMIGRGGRFVSRPGSEREDVYPDQLAGQRVPDLEQFDERGRGLLQDWAVWSDFKLSQPNADGFSVVKRTNLQSAWIPAGAGRRAGGFAFIGDVNGGLGVSVRNFWQSHPTALEVRGAASGEARLVAWLWSPDAPAMDMRHYDTRAHGLEAVYEDVQPGLSTPHGVARTSELMLFATAGVPTHAEAAKLAQIGGAPPLLVCSPEHLHQSRAIGIWSLPDRSTPFKAVIEKRLDGVLAHYLDSAEQHHWYGFWDFGDVMHSYDQQRHVWRYDLGGMAWDNTELGTDLWLWTSFLRSGRADLFRMAEAMTRHTSEVDCYHLGKLAGLGSRHNVRHWGCGAKEARISMATLRRPYYYLTTDERTGDLMRSVLNVDFKAAEFDPMRIAQPITEAEAKYPARIRAGPDWLAFVANWMTEWERTGDTRWRDKIYAGMDSFLAMPYWFRTGKNLVSGYDPKTGRLFQVWDEIGDYNLATIQGGAQVVFELNELIDHPGWQKAWLQYCRLGNAPAEVVLRDKETGAEGADGSWIGERARTSQGTPRLAAYVYWKTRNKAFAEPAIASGLARLAAELVTESVDGPVVPTPRTETFGSGPGGRRFHISTNDAAQSGLTAIEILELCKDVLPAEIPAPPARLGGTRRQGGN